MDAVAGRFFSLSFYAYKAVIEAAGRLAVAIERFSKDAQPPIPLADVRQYGGKRANRWRTREAIDEAERLARSVPPVAPSWLVQRAPWAQYMGFIRPRGRRRMRDWT